MIGQVLLSLLAIVASCFCHIVIRRTGSVLLDCFCGRVSEPNGEEEEIDESDDETNEKEE